jgi:hypothetical protein
MTGERISYHQSVGTAYEKLQQDGMSTGSGTGTKPGDSATPAACSRSRQILLRPKTRSLLTSKRRERS